MHSNFFIKNKNKRATCLNVVVSTMQYSRRGETFLKIRFKIIIQNRYIYKRLESICMTLLHTWFRWHTLETLDKWLRSRFQFGGERRVSCNCEFPVSCSMCKKLTSCHSASTRNKKLKKQKHQQPFLNPWERKVGYTAAPKIETDGKTGHHSFLEQKFTGRDWGRN